MRSRKQEVRDTYVRKKDPELSIAGYARGVPSLHSYDSSPGEKVVASFIFEFEAIRTESGPRPPFESRFGPNRLKFGPETTHLHH